MRHDYTFLSSHGEDAPGKSLDTYSFCGNCGTVRHDYAHGGGQTSPNYPLFVTIGFPGWRAIEPECRSLPPYDPDPTACLGCGGKCCDECNQTGWRPA